MQDGEYPAQMKVAKVIALYEKGERYKANNYRPISLLSCFSKIFERLLGKRLIKFLIIIWYSNFNLVSVNYIQQHLP